VDLRLVNRKVVESLIKCGALDSFKAYRAQMMAILDRALAVGAKSQKEKAMGQVSFFDLTNESGFQQETENLPDVKEWSKTQILSFEKEILGFYVSGHPLTHYAVEIKEFTNFTTKDLRETIDGEQVRLVGLLEEIKLTNTRKTNERMAIVRLEDMEGSVEVVLFPSTYTQLAKYLNEGEVVFLSGRVSRRDDEPKIIATDMKQMQEVYGAIKTINVDLAGVDQQKLKDLKEKLTSFPGKVPVYLRLDTESHKSIQILVGEDLFVTPNEELMNEIKELVGDGNFSLTL
jgi:DNA polymerase-3 subunit alpha